MTDIRDPDVLADAVLPLGGPYPPEALTAAAGLLAELVRRLNHATFDPAVEFPSQVDAVVGRLHGAVAGMPQLCNQLAGLLGGFARTPGLYATPGAHPDDPGDVIGVARGHLGHAAHGFDAVADRLNAARNLTARLGVHTADEEDQP